MKKELAGDDTPSTKFCCTVVRKYRLVLLPFITRAGTSPPSIFTRPAVRHASRLPVYSARSVQVAGCRSSLPRSLSATGTLRTTAAPTDMPQMERSCLFFPRKEQAGNAEPEPLARHIRVNRKALEALFHLKLKDAAREIGLCSTTFKKACRRFQIEKWPSKRGQRDAAFAQRSAQTDDIDGAAFLAWRDTPAFSFSFSATASSTPTASPTKLPRDYRATSPKLPLDYPDAFGAVFSSASCISIGVPMPVGQHPNGRDGLTTWHEETQAFLTGTLKETWNEETPGFLTGTRKEGYDLAGACGAAPRVTAPTFAYHDICLGSALPSSSSLLSPSAWAHTPSAPRVSDPPFSSAFWATEPFEDVFERVNTGGVPSAAGEPPPASLERSPAFNRGSGPGEESCLEAVMAYLDGPLAPNFDFMFDDEEA